MSQTKLQYAFFLVFFCVFIVFSQPCRAANENPKEAEPIQTIIDPLKKHLTTLSEEKEALKLKVEEKTQLMPGGIDRGGAPNLLVHNEDLPQTIVGMFPCKGLVQVEMWRK